MRYIKRIKKAIIIELLLLAGLGLLCVSGKETGMLSLVTDAIETTAENEDVIRWVDFNVSYEALNEAYHFDVTTYGEETHVEWIPLLAYTAAKNGGKFDKTALKCLKETGEKLAGGECKLEELTDDLKYYDYYLEAYEAVLGGFVGEYQIETKIQDGEIVWAPHRPLWSVPPEIKSPFS